MHHDARAYLWDILKASDAIQEFTAGLDSHSYANNEIVHSAVERKFEIVGEALSKLAKTSPDLASRIPDIAAIIAFRNVLIHGYASIEHERVWRIAETSLPILRSTVSALLDQMEPGQNDR
jgi:uncharacterized protein with HEPN domain